MVQINKFRINTHFTALKQLPQQYKASFQIGGSYGYTIGQKIGSAIINVPGGSYVETPLIRCSIDDNVNHLAPEFIHYLNNYVLLIFSINQISSSQYELKAVLNNTASANVTVPNSTVTGILRLAIAPFSS